jgi:sarcosine oxidase, subunit gamma
MLEHRAPLEQLSPPSTTLSGDSALRIVPVTGRGLLLIQARSADASLADILDQQLGLRVPQPLTSERRDAAALLWLAPREWLLELPAAQTPSVHAALESSFAQAGAQSHHGEGSSTGLRAVYDVSDAFAGFDLSGTRVVDVLMSSCSLDLRPHSFPADHCVRTAVADTPAILWKPSECAHSGVFRCWVERGFAAHLVSWFAESPARW